MLSQYQYKSQTDESERLLPRSLEKRLRGGMTRAYGLGFLVILAAIWASLISWSAADPSLTHITRLAPTNIMGYPGAILSDLLLESLGLVSVLALLAPMLWATELTISGRVRDLRAKLTFFPLSIFLLSSAFASLPPPETWPLSQGMGGILGDAIYGLCHLALGTLVSPALAPLSGAVLFAIGLPALAFSIGIELKDIVKALRIGSRAGTPDLALVPGQETVADYRPEPGFATSPFSGGDTAPEPVDAHSHELSPTPAASPARSPAAHARASSWQAEEPPLLRRADTRNQRAVEPDTAEADLPPSLRPRAAAVPADSPVTEPRPEPAASRSPRDRSFDLDTDADSAAIARRFAPANRKNTPGYAAYVDPPRTGSDWKSPEPEPAPSSRFDLPPDEMLIGFERDPVAPARQPAFVAAERAPIRRRNASASALKPSPQLEPAVAVPETAPRGFAPETPAPWEADVVPAYTPSPVLDAEPLAGSASAETKPAPKARNIGYLASARVGYKRPSIHLLEPGVSARPGPEYTQTVMRAQTRILKEALNDFGIKGEVSEIRQGPVVTLFELEPQRGTKTSRVIALADDIARAMSVKTARIAAMPGRSAIGIELPNVRREPVLLRDLIDSEAYRRFNGPLPLALGKSIEGTPIVSDLTRMPHLLVAGQAGSGKSVTLHAMIQSLIYRHGPDDCRLLLIDPGMVELSEYNDAPHLLCPVITDANKALAALNWVVAELEERHKRMSKLGVRNIEIFNNRINNARKRGEMIARTVNTGFDQATGEPIYEYEQMDPRTMPYIVVAIDEFADMMRVAGSKVEAVVQRITSMAQAAGVHLIMGTRHLSPEVITPALTKSLRTRISFRTPTQTESRLILGVPGADQLLEHGDMLLSSGTGHCSRVHAAHVTAAEVEAVMKFIRAGGSTAYDDDLVAVLDTCEPAGPVPPVVEDHYSRASGPRLARQRPHGLFIASSRD